MAVSPKAKERIIGGLWAAAWMWPLISPVIALAQGKISNPLWPALGLATFVGLYIVVVTNGFDVGPLIVVKAEVVRRLVERDPALARQAAADIEEIGRRALTEVREAVDGYRAPDFTTTVDTVRAALADSRIALRVRHDGPPLPPATSQTFGWVIREAATNAIRHSHAKAADVTLTVTHVDAVLEFRDDGRGVRGLVGASRAGSGLIGLRERVTAAGGTFSVGNVDGGGFRVVATMPAGAAIDTGTRTAETAPGVRTIARAAVVSVASADAAPDDREAPA
ncbi:MAG TPA: ATP-binding protein [Micromonosporaceae bacterium]|jgi:hypothetical protein